MPRRTVLLHRQDIDRTHDVPVSAETTLPTGIPSAAWFVPTPALRARLTGVAFAHQFDRDTFRFCLVGDVLSHLPVRPVRDFLIALLAELPLIGNIPHISDGNRACLHRHRCVHHLAGNLVFHIAGALRLLVQKAVDTPLQALPHAGATFAVALPLAQFGKPFGGVLALAAQFPAGDNHGVVPITHRCRVDFPRSTATVFVPGAAFGCCPFSTTMCQKYRRLALS